MSYKKSVEKLLDLIRKGRVRPGVHHILVEHDHWCALLHGVGPCNCDPDIRHAPEMDALKGGAQ